MNMRMINFKISIFHKKFNNQSCLQKNNNLKKIN